MAGITVAQITELRNLTNAGMMDCKKALIDTKGDMEAAIKILREKGLAIQVKRADKEANQGIVKAAVSDSRCCIALAEINCETDFVAKTDGFKDFADKVAKKVLAGDENVAESMKDEVVAIVAATGENVKIRRAACFKLSGTGLLESYIHMGGKVGVMVEVSCEKAETIKEPAFVEMVHDLALQIAAAAPRWLDSTQVPADVIASENEIYRAQVLEQNKDKPKPANIVEKILEGKIKKFFGEVCLVDQVFVKDESKTQTISQLVGEISRKVNDKIFIKRFVRYQLGAV